METFDEQQMTLSAYFSFQHSFEPMVLILYVWLELAEEEYRFKQTRYFMYLFKNSLSANTFFLKGR